MNKGVEIKQRNAVIEEMQEKAEPVAFGVSGTGLAGNQEESGISFGPLPGRPPRGGLLKGSRPPLGKGKKVVRTGSETFEADIGGFNLNGTQLAGKGPLASASTRGGSLHRGRAAAKRQALAELPVESSGMGNRINNKKGGSQSVQDAASRTQDATAATSVNLPSSNHFE
jgi:hypothetical protein